MQMNIYYHGVGPSEFAPRPRLDSLKRERA